MIKVRAHTCYLGTTGFAAHSRSFFREFSKHVDLRVRNYTWDDKPDYLNEVDESIIDTITLSNGENSQSDYPIKHSFPHRNWVHANSEDFTPDVDIVLMDMNHHYFYEEYQAPIKIAYTVWESTELEEGFFNQLLKFDYVWVVTGWHRKMIIDQGYPAYRVFVVNEGVDSSLYNKKPSKSPRDKFEFMFFGRWDYRKSLPEIVKSFIDAFPDNDEVELILSADNPYSIDGFNSTEERLLHYGLTDDRIKVKHFLGRNEYEGYIKNGHVLITCARSEGWNIPLIEAMSAGTPVIYSNWGAQLEFAGGRGNPVSVSEERLANIGCDLGFAGNTPGLYCEPDFEDLKRVMIDCFENWGDKKNIARKEAEEIHSLFNWEKVGKDGYEILRSILGECESPKRGEDAVVIMAHADTPEKTKILRSCISTLSSQGYTTIVSTHIPLDESVKELPDMVVYDKDNPIVYSEEYEYFSNMVPVHYMNYPDFKLSYRFDFNHGYAALKLIKNGIGVAEANGFGVIHFVNYDYIINDKNLLDSHREKLDNYDLISYKWNEVESINSAFFSARTESIKNALKVINSKQSYFKYENCVILEDVLYKICEESSLNIEINRIEDIAQKNILNTFILSAFPQIKAKNGEYCYIYLCNDSEGNKYLGLIGAPGEDLKAEIIYQNNSASFTAQNYPMLFINIPDYMLEGGFTVNSPRYGITNHYDITSKRANCVINNPKIIRNLEFKEIPSENIVFHFIDGPFVEITGKGNATYAVQFIDTDKNEVIHSDTISINSWVRCSRKYFTNWLITVTNTRTNETHSEIFNLRDKKVLVHIDSSALGDSLAWFPHIEEFRKKHNCQVYVSTFKNELFKGNYQDLNFISPGSTVDGIYASYSIGWFFNSDDEYNLFYHPKDFRKQPMQETTTDILGLEYYPLPAKLDIPDSESPIEGPYVSIAMHSTAQAKYWNNPTGWQEVTDYFLAKGYKVVMISREEDGYMGNFYPKGVTIPKGERTMENAINHIRHSEMFIGISSGLSWLSWTIGTPTVIISGWSWPCTEVLGDHVIRVFKGGTCNGCFNRLRLDAGDWNWCPDQKGTNRQFECTKIITGSDVISAIEEYHRNGFTKPSIDQIVQESYELGMVQNHKEIYGASEFFKSLKVKNFMEIGTDQGGTFAIWSKLSEDGIRISVDLPHGQFGRSDYDEYQRDAYLTSLGSNVHMFWGDSHDYKMLENVENIIDSEMLDFLFIDGDHTYEGVKQDYEMYKHLVKPGGWIGFHDIKDTEFHRNANCRVDRLWNELTLRKKSWIDDTSSYGGIGFVQVEDK